MFLSKLSLFTFWVHHLWRGDALVLWCMLKVKRGFEADLFKEYVLVFHTRPYMFPKHDIIIEQL